jgi:hypothetical protein
MIENPATGLEECFALFTPIEFAIVNTSQLTRTGYDRFAHEIQCERD